MSLVIFHSVATNLQLRLEVSPNVSICLNICSNLHHPSTFQGILCVDELRAAIAAQSRIFTLECKKRKWEIEETSKIDAFMDKLQAHIEEYTERLNQIQGMASTFISLVVFLPICFSFVSSAIFASL